MLVCVLCGLPAAGKTTFCRALASSAAAAAAWMGLPAGARIEAHHLCLDRPERVLAQAAAVLGGATPSPDATPSADVPSSSSSAPAAAAEPCRSSAQVAVPASAAAAAPRFEPAQWKRDRVGSVAALETLLRAWSGAGGASGQEARGSPPVPPPPVEPRTPVSEAEAAAAAAMVASGASRSGSREVYRVVLVDDNMHLRSMRRKMYQLARTCRR